MGEQTAKEIRRLGSRLPLLGLGIRGRAARRLGGAMPFLRGQTRAGAQEGTA